uniref:hypothetical protein n=1 Tax=uncultured Acidovorax sp. TaxID=158751 RepID=UPI0025CD2218|nr:hypothetical protein [uncultured Acidovorax sp.]
MTPTNPLHLHRRTLLLGLAGCAVFDAPLATQAASPAAAVPHTTGPGTSSGADDTTLARLLDRVTWGCTGQGVQALGGLAGC